MACGKTLERFGRFEAPINNAGITMYTLFGGIEDLSLVERIMKVNYLGSVYCTYFALPYLKKSRGRLVAISSLTGKAGVPTRTAYSASKHAMAGFFDSLRIELAGSGVSVTVIYPGFVATEIRKNAFGKTGKPLGWSHIKESRAMEVGKAVQKMLKAIAARKRKLLMGTKAKIGVWMKLISPSLVDKIARRSIEKGKTEIFKYILRF